MRKHASRWLNGLRSSLYLEILEARNPVSEGFNTATSLASLAGVGYALRAVQPTPPPPDYQSLRS